MSSILIIIVAILAVAGLAYLIVNKLPSKLKPVVSIVLWAIIIYLGYNIYQSIMKPIHFNQIKKVKYAKVIENLKVIRDAELAYGEVHRKFTANSKELINFIEKDSFAITEIKNIVVTEQRGRITVDVEKRIVDTVGFEPVSKSFEGRDYKNMMTVPGTDAKFGLAVGTVEKVQGVQASVFEAKVDKSIVLQGMDEDLINQEKEALGGINVPGEFISVGSLEDVNSNGNWHPFYDGRKEDTN
jgi:energy-coupling factor transporter transmembrane protein EcfT